MNLSNRIKALKARLKLQKPEIITNPVQKDELVEQDLCGKDLCDLDHSTIKLLSGDCRFSMTMLLGIISWILLIFMSASAMRRL